MRYIKFTLEDGTLAKFKIRRLMPYGLEIAWKYIGRLNTTKYIDLGVVNEWSMRSKIEYLQQISDKNLIDKYRDRIEEHHNKLKNIKRRI